jgi:hypothetical protein
MSILKQCTSATFPLPVLRKLCSALGYHHHGIGEHTHLIDDLQKWHSVLVAAPVDSPFDFFRHFEQASKLDLSAQAGAHGLSCAGSTDVIRTMLADHFT